MQQPATTVLVCVFDGLRPDMITPALTPHLWRLRERGVWFERSHCVFPSVTRVNSASLSTGCFPGVHGLEGNTIWRPAVEPSRRLQTSDHGDLRRLAAYHGRTLRPPTIGEVLAGAGLASVAVGTGSSGGTFLMHPEAERCGGLVYHHDFTTPASLAADVAGVIGPAPALANDPMALALARVEYGARVLTEVLTLRAAPALASFWITLPDGAHHRFGLGAPESNAAIAAVDQVFGRMLARLAEQGMNALDVIVTADHGYATVSGHVDVSAALVEAGLKRSPESTELVLCVDGGACLLYCDGSVDLAAVAMFLLRQPWTAAVFSRTGAVQGTLPLAAVGCEGQSAPELLLSLAWSDARNAHGRRGMSLGQGGIAVGAGDHGGISPLEMRNTLLAAGPHVRSGIVSEIPAGIVDIAPTVLRCLGLAPPPQWQGRVLSEALVNGGPAPPSTAESVIAEAAGRRQVLDVLRVGAVSYVSGAQVGDP